MNFGYLFLLLLQRLLLLLENDDSWLLFPLAAMNFGYLFLQRILLLLLVPGWENTMAVKDGEAPKLHPGNA